MPRGVTRRWAYVPFLLLALLSPRLLTEVYNSDFYAAPFAPPWTQNPSQKPAIYKIREYPQLHYYIGYTTLPPTVCCPMLTLRGTLRKGVAEALTLAERMIQHALATRVAITATPRKELPSGIRILLLCFFLRGFRRCRRGCSVREKLNNIFWYDRVCAGPQTRPAGAAGGNERSRVPTRRFRTGALNFPQRLPPGCLDFGEGLLAVPGPGRGCASRLRHVCG